MSDIFDAIAQRRNSDRSASRYRAAAVLSAEIASRLLESLDYLDDRRPHFALDLGSGPGSVAERLSRRWPRARVLALDWSLPMLRQAAGAGWWRRRPRFARLCADVRALPLADGSVDLAVSNLCLHAVEDVGAALAELRRVLRPDGLLLFSALGPETLWELRAAFAEVDPMPHVHPFPSIQRLGDALLAAGFRDPVLDRERLTTTYSDFRSLLDESRTLGGNVLASRRRSLTGRGRFDLAERAYRRQFGADRLPCTWEAIYAQAWSPGPGVPRRERGAEIASMPVAEISIRRRRTVTPPDRTPP